MLGAIELEDEDDDIDEEEPPRPKKRGKVASQLAPGSGTCRVHIFSSPIGYTIVNVTSIESSESEEPVAKIAPSSKPKRQTKSSAKKIALGECHLLGCAMSSLINLFRSSRGR